MGRVAELESLGEPVPMLTSRQKKALIYTAVGVPIVVFLFFVWILFGGPIKPVSAKAWSQLRQGMTQAEVRDLLGLSWATMESSGSGSWWAYNWSDGFQNDVAPSYRAYVVFFDENKRVKSWREPVK